MDISAIGGTLFPLPTMEQGYVAANAAVLDRYRHLRTIMVEHHSGALTFVASTTLVEHAKKLGLVFGRTLIADSDEEVTLVFDLALHTAKEGRSRAIDRYSKALRPEAASDEARMLQAMRQAEFSIWKIDRLHDTAGLVVTDILRKKEVWLVDESLEISGEPGMLFASRLSSIDGFAMTSGVIVPVTEEIVDDVLGVALGWRHAELSAVAQDPRFATAIYRAALDSGIMEHVSYR